MPDDEMIQPAAAADVTAGDPPAALHPVGVAPAPLPAPVAPAKPRKAARPKAVTAKAPARKAATKPTKAAAEPTDPAQAIALHCLHPSQYVEHMPPGKDVTVEWVKARLVYAERLNEILATGAYEKTEACPRLPHDPLCGR